MVTVEHKERSDFGNSWELRGLSTDVKPTEVDGIDVPNGSTFFEINTAQVSMYSASDKTWYPI